MIWILVFDDVMFIFMIIIIYVYYLIIIIIWLLYSPYYLFSSITILYHSIIYYSLLFTISIYSTCIIYPSILYNIYPYILLSSYPSHIYRIISHILPSIIYSLSHHSISSLSLYILSFPLNHSYILFYSHISFPSISLTPILHQPISSSTSIFLSYPYFPPSFSLFHHPLNILIHHITFSITRHYHHNYSLYTLQFFIYSLSPLSNIFHSNNSINLGSYLHLFSSPNFITSLKTF